MQKKRRNLLAVLSVCAVSIGAFSLALCDFKNNFLNRECVHAWKLHIETGAECMQYGAGTETCLLCGDIRQTVVAPLGHTMSDGGCTVCGARESEGLQVNVVATQMYNGEPLYAEIVGIGSCTDTDLIIPTEIDGLPVMRIYDSAFNGNQDLTSVYIDIPIVGDGAFANCVNLEIVSFSKNVMEMGASVLNNTAFYNLSRYWTDDSLYLGDVLLNSKAKGEYYVKEGTRLIAGSSFYSGDKNALTKVVLPESVEYIGNNAFSGNANLSQVEVGKNIRKIGAEILSETAYEKNKENWKGDALYLGENLLKIREKEQTEYDVAEGTRLIADSACACHDTLVHLTLPKSLLYINDNAFTNCYKLVEVYNQSKIPLTAGEEESSGLALHALHIYREESERRVSIENDFILYKDGEEISLVGYLGKDTAVTIPDGVTTIHQNAFAFEKSLVSVTFPNGVKVIEENAFWGCDSLTEVNFSEGLTKIENCAFSGCALVDLVLPDGLEQVGFRVFENNKNLKSVVISSSVQYLSYGVFSDCVSLENVTFKDKTDWVLTWSSLEGEQVWDYFLGYTYIDLCEDLLSKLTDQHAKYAFVQWEYLYEYYPQVSEE